jgi:hypothetical protein
MFVTPGARDDEANADRARSSRVSIHHEPRALFVVWRNVSNAGAFQTSASEKF